MREGSEYPDQSISPKFGRAHRTQPRGTVYPVQDQLALAEVPWAAETRA